VGLFHALLDALTPPLCALCGAPPGPFPWLCADCSLDFTLLPAPFCLRCGAPRPVAAPTCARCPDWPPILSQARSASPHEGTARELVHLLKFHRALHAARPLGAIVAAAARDLPLPRDAVVVPVPLHRSRRIERGFNQALEIAAPAARILGLALRPRLLVRVRSGAPAGQRSRRGRLRESRGAFRARPEARGRTILVVDDVLTTGATLAACATALARRGAEAVYAVTATRAFGG